MIFQNYYLTAREITYNNFEISLMVFMPNVTTNHAITYTNQNKRLSEKVKNKFAMLKKFIRSKLRAL